MRKSILTKLAVLNGLSTVPGTKSALLQAAAELKKALK